MNNEIRIKLVVDDRAVNGTLTLTDEQIRRIYSSVNTLGNSPLLKQFAEDLLNIGVVSGEATEGIQDFIKYNHLSEKQINEVINSLRQAQSVLGMETAEYKQHSVAIENLARAYTSLHPNVNLSSSAFSQSSKGLSGFNMLIGQTGFLLSDMDMFFVNFRMGLLSVGNNISMVASTIGIAMNQAKESNLSFGAAIKQSLSGFNLFLIGINAGMFVIQMLARLFQDTTKEISKQKEEVKNLADEYKKLTRAQLENKLAEAESNYQKTWGLFTTRKVIDRETGKASYVPTPDYLKPQAMRDAEKGIQLLKDSLFMLGEIDNINNRLVINREKLNHLNEQNFATLVQGAKTYEEAKATLDKWIEGDEKSLKVEKEKAETGKEISIRTDEQIKKEIAILKVRLSQAQSAREILEYIKAIVQLEQSLSSGTPSAQPETHSNEPPTAKQKGPMKELPEKYQKPVAVTETTAELEMQYGMILLLGREWQHLGNTMSAALSRAILKSESLNDTLSLIGEQLLQMAIMGLFGGIGSFFSSNVSFLQGFFGALGIHFAEGGVINEPVLGLGLRSGQSYTFAEKGIPEIVLPSNKFSLMQPTQSMKVDVNVTNEASIRGHDLYFVVKRIEKRIKRYQ